MLHQLMTLTPALLDRALGARKALFEKLHAEKTNAYRLFHGTAEGAPGLTIDRYGGLVLVQTFREPLAPEALRSLEGLLRERTGFEFALAYNHRGKTAKESFDQWHQPSAEALGEFQCQEFGLSYHIRARHQGIDPWLFLDLRAGRRFVRSVAKDCSVLNLFSYTCSVGVCAAAAGAKEVWNVDFAASNLEVGRRNAEANHIPEARFQLIQQDCMPVLRQLAGLPVGGRHSQRKKSSYLTFAPRQFDLVFLDPVGWSKGAFGAVDVVSDYPSLFKPAVLATRPGGGRVIATNHMASVELEGWLDVLKRCAAKAGQPLRSVEVITPDADFPTFDGRHPLKIAVCEV